MVCLPQASLTSNVSHVAYAVSCSDEIAAKQFVETRQILILIAFT